FFYKFFHDRGWVRGSDEPFTRLFNQGMVLRNGEKMSKSRGNVIGIDETVEKQGVDAMRLFLLYATPPEDTMEWTEEGISGRVRFINRVWRACEPSLDRAGSVSIRGVPSVETAAEKELLRAVHVAVKSAVDETLTRRMHYNATIAKLDEYVNALTALSKIAPQSPAVLYAVHALPVVIAPFAPHIAEELWEQLGHRESVHLEPYLQPDENALAVKEITLVVQVNGKVRARIQASPRIDENGALALAVAHTAVQTHLTGKQIRKQIYVPGKLLNLVTG
ncbi:MAG: class I tRNA ligase family protein, partial [Candidatus Baltobacteraceae bacterium]